MNDVDTWQREAGKLFRLMDELYETAQTAWNEAVAFFNRRGWQPTCGTGLGGHASASTDLANWPFTYLAAMGAYAPGDNGTAPKGTAALFGFLFYDGRAGGRIGPVSFAGSVTWSSKTADCDHWMLCRALGGGTQLASKERFDVTRGIINSATPLPSNKKDSGVESVRWFEVHLGALTSVDRLHAVLSAAIALVGGDQARALSEIRDLAIVPA